jgi:hypothetical protein
VKARLSNFALLPLYLFFSAIYSVVLLLATAQFLLLQLQNLQQLSLRLWRYGSRENGGSRIMFGKLKIYAVAAFAFLMVIIGIFKAGGKSATNEIRSKSLEKEKEITALGREAADAGRVREQAIREEDIDPEVARDYFEK